MASEHRPNPLESLLPKPARNEQAEFLQAQETLRQRIHGQLETAAADARSNGHLDAVVITDHADHVYEHLVNRPEADDIERAEWDLNGDQTIDGLAQRIIADLPRHGIDVSRPDDLDIKVIVKAAA